jgi:riboflavin transporter FmnP
LLAKRVCIANKARNLGMLSGRKNIILQFILRGAIFGGFGPIIVGIVYLCISASVEGFNLSAKEVLIGIVSVYLLAFIQGGASVFNQIESWPIPKSLLFHFSSIYIAYIMTYLVNSWIPFNIIFILVFTGIFILTYLVIWITVYLCVKATKNKLNKALKK